MRTSSQPCSRIFRKTLDSSHFIVYNLHMSDFTNDIITIITKHGCEDIDSTGQIVIYTGLMYDEDGKIVPWEDEYADE